MIKRILHAVSFHLTHQTHQTHPQ